MPLIWEALSCRLEGQEEIGYALWQPLGEDWFPLVPEASTVPRRAWRLPTQFPQSTVPEGVRSRFSMAKL